MIFALPADPSMRTAVALIHGLQKLLTRNHRLDTAYFLGGPTDAGGTGSDRTTERAATKLVKADGQVLCPIPLAAFPGATRDPWSWYR